MNDTPWRRGGCEATGGMIPNPPTTAELAVRRLAEAAIPLGFDNRDRVDRVRDAATRLLDAGLRDLIEYPHAIAEDMRIDARKYLKDSPVKMALLTWADTIDREINEMHAALAGTERTT